MAAFYIIVIIVCIVIMIVIGIWAYRKHDAKVKGMMETPATDTQPGMQQMVVTVRATSANLAEQLRPYTSQGWRILSTTRGGESTRMYTTYKWTVILERPSSQQIPYQSPTYQPPADSAGTDYTAGSAGNVPGNAAGSADGMDPFADIPADPFADTLADPFADNPFEDPFADTTDDPFSLDSRSAAGGNGGGGAAGAGSAGADMDEIWNRPSSGENRGGTGSDSGRDGGAGDPGQT